MAPAQAQFDRVTASLNTGRGGMPSSSSCASPSKGSPPSPLAGPFAIIESHASASPDAAVDITCFLRTRVTTQAPQTPKVKDMECLLMSPTRRTGRKANAWHWNYNMAPSALADPAKTAPANIAGKGTPPLGSPTGSATVDAAAANLVANLQMGTPVALASGLLSDASDRT
ncbi:hypothetical protein GPECTOR_114g316 [Gonium pectorale]|uniref:Uncharacterized protein n=1 Tax=Gonium pectorale TaxID=33097 RepID=A0A150G079_GONPE|nr:hypothetical protein GPECTOR_114g316 [Gonium pectorale]|eukprot:KXZ42865.1 hypothetical protein GPECTOR_114g316 [Gonium pectorale]